MHACIHVLDLYMQLLQCTCSHVLCTYLCSLQKKSEITKWILYCMYLTNVHILCTCTIYIYIYIYIYIKLCKNSTSLISYKCPVLMTHGSVYRVHYSEYLVYLVVLHTGSLTLCSVACNISVGCGLFMFSKHSCLML